MYYIVEDEDINHNLILQHFVLQASIQMLKLKVKPQNK